MNEINKKILILVIEDETILANALKEKLENEGFKVSSAYDGVEGLILALKEHPDLILLDLLIPKVDGMEIIKKLQEDSWGKNAKLIILTNVSDSTRMSKGWEISKNKAYPYVLKTDISLEEIVSKIKKELEIKS